MMASSRADDLVALTKIEAEGRWINRLSRLDLLWFAGLTVTVGVLVDVFNSQFWFWQYVVLATWYVTLVAVGVHWRAFQAAFLTVLSAALLGVWLYSIGQTPANDIILRYVLQGYAGAMWMIGFLLAATAAYLIYLFTLSEKVGRLATGLTWVGVLMGFIALGVRWRETYLGHPDWGHVPVTNLWEVMIVFCAATSLFYLYYESRFKSKALGAFVMPLVAVSAVFLAWLTFVQHMNRIAPIIPALQSFWMKLHVPMMFVSYANFTIASLVGLAYILADRSRRSGGGGILARALPSGEIMDNMMSKAIALGFLLFTIATILGAVWAAKAWGGFWSWDPKETWALIVWLNYAGYLHARTSKGWRGKQMAWWSFMSLWVVTFCFLGVNLFLSGLHSYGKL
nr:c-type cytochrome biogenesis protein CcsB [Acidithiobacillus ferrivorans]